MTRSRARVPDTAPLASALGQLYHDYNREDSATDPVQLVRPFTSPADREIAGFCAAALAFGRVASVMASIRTLFEIMGHHPAQFVRTFDPRAEHRELHAMVHRWTRGVDIAALLWILRQMLEQSGSLERFFADGVRDDDVDVGPALDRFSERALAIDLRLVYKRMPKRPGVCYFFPRPSAGSACKRLNLYLRWMVRTDAVDLGVWRSLPPSKLVVPLDTHVIRLSRCLRLTKYTSPGWKMASDITASLRRLDPDDPVRFDFSLCHVGMMNACGFGRRQGDSQCPLSSRRAFMIAAVILLGACGRAPAPYVVNTHASPDGSHIAAVRLAQCGTNWCDSLWIGESDQTATLVTTLPYAAERATEIAWTKDSRRVGFLINGHQLRLFDAVTKAPAGQVDLVPPDARPTTRIARGVTFSENGAAITFDDCPRDRSGCRSGFAALK